MDVRDIRDVKTVKSVAPRAELDHLRSMSSQGFSVTAWRLAPVTLGGGFRWKKCRSKMEQLSDVRKLGGLEQIFHTL